MVAPINVQELEEFRFTFGDPRPVLLEYLDTQLENFHSLVNPRATMKKTQVPWVHCGGTKRRMVLPTDTKRLEKLVKDPKVGLVVVPIKMIGKKKCQLQDKARHIAYLLYNKHTHEIERIDTKRYHLQGFRMKLLVGSLIEEFVPFFERFDDNITYYHEVDTDAAFAKKIGMTDVKNAFPVFVIAYLNVRNLHPELKSDQVLAKTRSLSRKSIEAYWQAYVAWRASSYVPLDKKVCAEGLVKNLETNKCLAPMSKAYVSNLFYKPQKPCKSPLVFDVLSEKCVAPEKLQSINVRLDDLAGIKISNKTKYDHLGGAENSIAAMNFVLSKHPTAKLVLPGGKGKAGNALVWRKRAASGQFEFVLPETFWDAWQVALYDPAVQFLVVLVSLNNGAGGAHANVLLYDKRTNEMERFDGHGTMTHVSYEVEKLDEEVRRCWEGHMATFALPRSVKQFKYYTPLDYCPRMASVFQSKEVDEIPGKDVRGNCAVWRTWYVDVRLSNPHLKRKQVVTYAMKKLTRTGSLYKFIKSYQLYLARGMKDGKGKRKANEE